MKLQQWYKLRGPGYIWQRSASLLSRYSIHPTKAEARVVEGVKWLADLGCAPTFPVPARVIHGHPQFFQKLQNAGVEIAVHGYDHVALAEYTPAQASKQLIKAAEVFSQHHIEAHGFRCPYLSWKNEIVPELPKGLFGYSSNRAIEWDVFPDPDAPVAQPAIREVLDRVYKPESAREIVSVPSFDSGILEIPVCLPDDLELHDARRLDAAEMGDVWNQVLVRTHQRGELFVLMYHPELMSECQQPLSIVLHQASKLKPAVWIARLRDISTWWHEKARFSYNLQQTSDGINISFDCSERATILARGLDVGDSFLPWDGIYQQIDTPVLHMPSGCRPLLGVDPVAPAKIVSFLQNHGYLLDLSHMAPKCTMYLDADRLSRINTEVALIRFIEESSAPLIRYGRWPNGARSALSITGDLDALTLLDYAVRLFI